VRENAIFQELSPGVYNRAGVMWPPRKWRPFVFILAVACVVPSLSAVIPLALLASFAHSNWLLLAAGFRPFGVPSTGMEQTVLSWDRVIADLRQYRNSRPKTRDVVIFSKDGTFFIKRVNFSEASRSEDVPTWLRKMDYTRKGRSVQATSQ